jgi:hypothetical protein
MKGGLTLSVLSSIKVMLSRMSLIAKCQGKIGFVKYFKQVSVITQKVIGKDKTLTTTPRVKTTKSGIPCFFPSYIRKCIRLGLPWSIRLSLTICSFFRDILYTSKVKTDTITNPFNGNEKVVQEVIKFIPSFTKIFIPLHLRGRTLLEGKMRIFPILTSSPQTSIREWDEDSSSPLLISSTSIISLMRSAAVMPKHYLEYFKILFEVVGVDRWNSSMNTFTAIQFGAEQRYFHLFESICYALGVNPGKYHGNIPQIEYAKKWANWILYKQDLFISILEYCMTLSKFYLKGPLRPARFIGKLGLKQEAAGKMRVFAMVDPWTQWILYPFHKALFSILDRRRDVDGTFNQLGPISRKQGKPCFSMDLSSATDRLPMSIQKPLIGQIFNLSDQQVNAWSQLLIERPYRVPRTKNTSVFYSVGQPMGALSSWAMLAMTHHLIVQFAAFQVYKSFLKKTYFTDYAVLGDDIVIFDTKVAKRYHSVILSLGVECNLSKSISSPSGDALEFAKRTFYRGENVSPSPLKEYFMSLNSIIAFVEYVKKYSLTIPQALRVAGFGYKVVSGYQKPFHKLNIKVRYLILLLGLSDTSFRKSLGQSLRHGHNRFLVGCSVFIKDYCDDLLQRIKRLENISKSYNLDSFISQPKWFIKDWVNSLEIPIGTSKKTPFFWFGNPLKKLGKTWFLTANAPIWIIRELNYKMVFSILSITNRVKSEVPDILDTAKSTHGKVLTGQTDPNGKLLTELILSLFKLLKLESDLAQRSLTDLCLRPSLKLSKRPGEPKLFRIHKGLTKVLKSLKGYIKSF